MPGIISAEDPRIVRFPKDTLWKLNHSAMQVGDVWCTTSSSPLAVLIKRKTWGWAKMFSLSHCSHVATVIKIQGQFFLLEALMDGIRISTCYEYLNPTLWNFGQRVVAIMRRRGMDDDDRECLNRQAVLLAEDFPKYDFYGAGAFQLPFLSHTESRLYCSECAHLLWNQVGLPISKNNQVTPKAFQDSALCENVLAQALA